MIAPPFDLDLETFLRGPNPHKKLDIHMVFAVPFEDFMESNGDSIPGYPGQETLYFEHLADSELGPELYYAASEIGLLALVDRTVVGCYLWSALVVQKDYQRCGIGRELVIHRLTLDGRNPVWNLDTASYSPAGLATHISAWKQVRGE